MEHVIKVNKTIIKVVSLKAKEIDKLYKKKVKPLKEGSLSLQDGIKVKMKVFKFFRQEFFIKYGIIVSRKVGKAVVRNFLRRKIREFIINSIKSSLKEKLSISKSIPKQDLFIFLVVVNRF